MIILHILNSKNANVMLYILFYMKSLDSGGQDATHARQRMPPLWTAQATPHQTVHATPDSTRHHARQHTPHQTAHATTPDSAHHTTNDILLSA